MSHTYTTGTIVWYFAPDVQYPSKFEVICSTTHGYLLCAHTSSHEVYCFHPQKLILTEDLPEKFKHAAEFY